ncbi:ChbG/HpnK family deacetylase [Candidatus Sumerlaeota bacterium]|nr:ChbG/HpnK family deacetylase [Candidatus Sumerlaeota bacterium]
MGLEQSLSEETKEGEPSQKDQIELVIRLDDPGFCHSANMGLKKILEQGTCSSVSVIVATPWLDEVAELLRSHPEVSVGAHLVLNSEWKEFKWGPVSPYTEVSSIVDAFGKFFGSRRELMAQAPKVEEVEKELRAQIDLGLKKGLNFAYCDYHMGAAVNALEFQEIVEKLAGEYRIGISRYFGEKDTESIYSVPPDKKTDKAIEVLENLPPGRHLMVCHPGMNYPEMAAMTDLNSFGLKEMSVHRQAETDALCDPGFREVIRKRGIKLINYNHLRKEELHLMTRPFTAKPLEEVVRQARMEKKLERADEAGKK